MVGAKLAAAIVVSEKIQGMRVLQKIENAAELRKRKVRRRQLDTDLLTPFLSSRYAVGMNTASRPDPAIYQKLRANALQLRIPNGEGDSIDLVLMDWHLGSGTSTVLVASDGTASIYLSSGGGFIGAGQKSKTVHAIAIEAIQLARSLAFHCALTETIELPPPGEVFFYLRSNAGLRRGIATEAALRAGTDPLVALATTMQKIVSAYRVISAQQSAPKTSS